MVINPCHCTCIWVELEQQALWTLSGQFILAQLWLLHNMIPGNCNHLSTGGACVSSHYVVIACGLATVSSWPRSFCSSGVLNPPFPFLHRLPASSLWFYPHWDSSPAANLYYSAAILPKVLSSALWHLSRPNTLPTVNWWHSSISLFLLHWFLIPQKNPNIKILILAIKYLNKFGSSDLRNLTITTFFSGVVRLDCPP